MLFQNSLHSKTKIEKWYRLYTPWGRLKIRFLDYIVTRNINKILLHLTPLPKYSKNDINVVIAVKNRGDRKRVENAFKSIRNQDYSQNLIKITLVDYDSNKIVIPRLKKLCELYNVEYIRVENKPVWCKSHALNIAIKKAKTKYILSTDIDIIFREDYIKYGEPFTRYCRYAILHPV
jgi:cellulose synthase/poly-beta-1,6-N-acetylglucosamine synthase-like glycosyltransferase